GKVALFDTASIDPAILAHLVLVVLITATEDPGVDRGAVVGLKDVVSGHIELTAYGEKLTVDLDRPRGTLLDIDGNAVWSGLTFFVSGVNQDPIDNVLGVAK